MTRHVFRSLLTATILCLLLPLTPASSGTSQADLIRVIRTSKFAKPSPDPSGLAYLPGNRSLVIVDSEVEEGPLFAGANIWVWKPGKGVQRAFRTTRFSLEPTDVALSSTGKILYITDDTADRVYVWRKGGDGRWGTKDDRVRDLQTRAFGSADPTGATYGAKSLFVTDGDNTVSDHRVYRIRPGRNGRIDGAAPQGDDFVTSFDTVPLGITKPTDVVFQPGSRHLFLVSGNEDVIVEATLRGELVATYDISQAPIVSAAGIAFAPASGNPSATHVYVADRGKDNEDAPAENDGRLFEFDLR
jgi:DNA-binding beta-propeller fold protein YncE